MIHRTAVRASRFSALAGVLVALAASSGPAPSAAADRILVFTAPNTHAGQHGGSGLTFQQVADPQTWRHYRVGSAFYDESRERFVLGADATDTGGWKAAAGFHHSELALGTSSDGIAFTDWRTVLWVEPSVDDIRLFNLSILPDPARPGTLFGVFGFTQRSGTRGTARIEIDETAGVVRVASGPTTWTTHALGARLTAVPYRLTNAQVHSLARVEVGGSARYELWSFATSPKGAVPPCANGAPTPTYLANTADDTTGRKLVQWVYDPTTGALSGPVDASSLVRPMPTSYNASAIGLVTRHDLGEREALYSGTTDQRICDLPDNYSPWGGSSVLFTRVVRQPDGSYREEASFPFLNVKKPNWTCAPHVATCYAATPTAYGFVGAYPVRRGSTIYFYVQVWGGFVPS